VSFALAQFRAGEGWAEAGIVKDAGDDPDVTHGATILARVRHGAPGSGVTFRAGPGVGTVTRPGLPIPPGEPAINPVPRRMMTEALTALAAACDTPADFEVEVSVPGGEALALRTWNPRLGIEGGLSILGTTGIVRPFSCAAWIASIHRGIDVARASGLAHAAGSTGATSERAAQQHYRLPDHAMLDMGDFVGGMLKYLRRHPIPRVTIAGGFGKLVKFAQGALDLHSARSQVDFDRLALRAGDLLPTDSRAAGYNTAMEMLGITGPELAGRIAEDALLKAREVLGDAPIDLDVMVVDRGGRIIAIADRDGSRGQ
jgi:cobalt-precorrin-5B (C1)-methyltransferase